MALVSGMARFGVLRGDATFASCVGFDESLGAGAALSNFAGFGDLTALHRRRSVRAVNRSGEWGDANSRLSNEFLPGNNAFDMRYRPSFAVRSTLVSSLFIYDPRGQLELDQKVQFEFEFLPNSE